MRCPYKPTIIDEASGVEVANNLYKAYMEGWHDASKAVLVRAEDEANDMVRKLRAQINVEAGEWKLKNSS